MRLQLEQYPSVYLLFGICILLAMFSEKGLHIYVHKILKLTEVKIQSVIMQTPVA